MEIRQLRLDSISDIDRLARQDPDEQPHRQDHDERDADCEQRCSEASSPRYPALDRLPRPLERDRQDDAHAIAARNGINTR